ncbi:MAG: beta strand repeat-containing protein [Limisphaerales bacterium]
MMIPVSASRVRVSLLVFGAIWFLRAAEPAAAATYLVTNTADSGSGSFRQALLNANSHPGLDSILFRIPSIGGSNGPFEIIPSSALPSITDPVIIDATSQPGYAKTPLVEISGALLPAETDGLLLLSGGSTVRGLAINACPRDAIRIESLGTNVIEANFLGTDPSGTLPLGNGEGGVLINGSPGNHVGGTTAAERNVISGGNQNGIYLLGYYASGNIITGNYIGVTATGLTPLQNLNNGMEISGARANLIGGTGPGAGNVISGNGQSGIYLLTPGATGNVIAGNYIGLNAKGTAAVSNAMDGVTINGVAGNIVGGTSDGAANVISGNGGAGVYILTDGAVSNLVIGNKIGTDATGKEPIPNRGNGVIIDAVPGNTIGGTNAGARNIISGNVQNGVLIISPGASNNVVQGNYVGVDVTGSNALPNTFDGVTVDGATGNLIGGASGGNVISGNSANGILLINSIGESNGGSNFVEGNLIGTDYTGKKAVANAQGGIYIQAPGNTIGGVAAALRNVISGNTQGGIFIYGTNACNNLIEGNYIGVDITGEAGLGNGFAGIAVTNAPGDTIGGVTAGACNVISANGSSGIVLGGQTTAKTAIQGNFIGTDATGSNALGNLWGGIYLYGSGSNIIGGAVAGAGNLISGNLQEGLSVGDPGANYNTIQGNFIGTKLDGISPMGNQLHNVDFLDTAGNNLLGGTVAGADNHIAFATASQYDGVRIRAGCLGNFISRNCIFSNANLGIVIGAYPGLTSNMVTLTEAASDGAITSIAGNLSGYASSYFLIQFYENLAADPSGYGEGLFYIGSTNISTGSNGQAAFSVVLPVGVPPGRFLSATATDNANTTWEFGPDVEVTPPPPPSLSFTRVAAASNTPAAIVFSWPAKAAGFVLQQTTNLTPPAAWTSPTNAQKVDGATTSITVNPTGNAIFYRLVSP